MFELYEQLLRKRLYACQKTHMDMMGEVTCRLCNKAPESVAHVLAGCTALAQNEFVTWHDWTEDTEVVFLFIVTVLEGN